MSHAVHVFHILSSVEYLRDLNLFMHVVFKMTTDTETGTVVMASVGTGYSNVNKSVT